MLFPLIPNWKIPGKGSDRSHTQGNGKHYNIEVNCFCVTSVTWYFRREKGDSDWQPQRLHGQRKGRCGCLWQHVFLRISFPSPNLQLHSLGWYISDSSGASFPSIPLPIYILVSSGPIHLPPSYSTVREHMGERMNFCWVVAMYFVYLISFSLYDKCMKW